jgi:hypothetical protein
MKNGFNILLLFFILGCTDETDLFKNATALLDDSTPVSAFQLKSRSLENAFGTLEKISVRHPVFDSALIITTHRMTIMDWDVLVTCPVKKKLPKGDLLYLEFYGKAVRVKSGTNIGQVAFRYPSLLFSVQMDTVWRKYATYAVPDRGS